MRANAAWLGVLILPAIILTGCGEGSRPQQGGAPPPPQVTVALPEQRTVIDYDDYVGRFVAVDFVEIRARVSGYLDKVHFTDGQIVKEGDLLFTIDKRPFQTAFDQYSADLAQARATLAFAESDLNRAQQLVRDRTITEQTFDQRTQAKRVAQAIVNAREAQVRQAQLDLEFTELRAPITGRIGDRRVSPGNLVTGGTGGNTTLLATIVTSDPIRFEFTFDEASFLRYERLSTEGADVASRSGGVDVSLKLLDEKEYSHEGRMDFVDNVIDRTTGTIRGRAVFSNPSGVFTPGMFARVRVPGSPPYTATLVPEVAIGSEQTRKYVSVVDDQNVVHQKYVVLGQAIGDQRVIREGIAPTDRVVVNGLMRARPGTKVNPKMETPAPAAKGSEATDQPAASVASGESKPASKADAAGKPAPTEKTGSVDKTAPKDATGDSVKPGAKGRTGAAAKPSAAVRTD
ncbi:MAG: efflux RND transporter periplasmic adaptor subunit [Xanthobacteraceae bacterium]